MMKKRTSGFKPHLEILEDRCLLSFGTGGIVTTNFSLCDFANGVALQARNEATTSPRPAR